MRVILLSTFTRESSDGIVNSNIIYDNENKLLCDVNITPEIVIKHIRKLKKNKAPGPDNIGSSLLLNLCESLAEPLCIIFKKSMALEEIPIDWKLANVIPIYKKGE